MWFRWHILRSYCFVAEVTFKFNKKSWLQTYIEMNTDLTKAAKNDFKNTFNVFEWIEDILI